MLQKTYVGRNDIYAALQVKSVLIFAEGDLPSQEGEFRTLVRAIRKGRDTYKLKAAELHIGIHKQSSKHEPGESENKEGIVELSYGEVNILGNQAKFVNVTKRIENYQRHSKTITYEIKSKIWLTIHINAESIEEFQSAEKLLNKITSLRV